MYGRYGSNYFFFSEKLWGKLEYYSYNYVLQIIIYKIKERMQERDFFLILEFDGQKRYL